MADLAGWGLNSISSLACLTPLGETSPAGLSGISAGIEIAFVFVFDTDTGVLLFNPRRNSGASAVQWWLKYAQLTNV